MPTPDQLHRDLEELLDIAPQSVSAEDSLTQFDWDSMAVVMFIAMADQNYGVQVPPAQLRDAKTVADLFKLIAP